MEKPGLRDVSSVFQGHDAYAGATSGFETFNLLAFGCFLDWFENHGKLQGTFQVPYLAYLGT